MQNPALEGGRDGSRSVVDTELLEDVLDEPRGRRAADAELGRDFLVREATGEAPQDLHFARGEVRRNRVLVHPPRRLARNAVQARVNGAHGFYELHA
jgi:hypothetical protein